MKNIYGSRCKWRCVSNVHCVTFTPFFSQPPIDWKRFRLWHVSVLMTRFVWHWQMAICNFYSIFMFHTHTFTLTYANLRYGLKMCPQKFIAPPFSVLILSDSYHHRFTSETSHHHHDWHGYCFNGCALKTNIWSIEVSAERKIAIFIVSFIWKCHWHIIFIRSAFVRNFYICQIPDRKHKRHHTRFSVDIYDDLCEEELIVVHWLYFFFSVVTHV